MRPWWPLALACAVGAGCARTDVVGTLGCNTSRDCMPPDTICSADGRCVPGCVADPTACVGGSACDTDSGECEGAGLGAACGDDDDCAPPDVVCGVTTQTCEAGCTVNPGACTSDQACDPTSGHCCSPPGVGTCPANAPPMMTCNSDSECPDAPTKICSGGVCVDGCASGGGLCAAPLACNPTSGHCEPAASTCVRDIDCDSGSYCTQAGNCVVLAYAGPTPCAGGTNVTYTCATKTTPSSYSSCVGAPGPVGCPYCTNGSCLHPGLCKTSDDCHGGDGCVGGICRVLEQQCPENAIVPLGDVVSGTYAAGKELCVSGTVQSAKSGVTGQFEIRLDSSPYLYVDIEPMYDITPPSVGASITVHGTVRWDDGHKDRELLPVDWFTSN
ncbi:MAG TPA: hypothetical protein VGL86_31040 [Polyangia bacterium]